MSDSKSDAAIDHYSCGSQDERMTYDGMLGFLDEMSEKLGFDVHGDASILAEVDWIMRDPDFEEKLCEQNVFYRSLKAKRDD